MTQIKFGTDGWRAVMGEDFTEENVAQVIQAFCDWRLEVDGQAGEIVLGFDRRRDSDKTARLVAEVLAGNGFKVYVSDSFCPTPCVSWMVKVSDAIAGVMVTASHNPPQWNGIKFKESYGGSAAPEYTQCIEKQLVDNQQQAREVQQLSYQEAVNQQLILSFNPHQNYLDQLRSLVDCQAIQDSSLKVLVDPLFGAGSHFLPALLPEQVSEIHADADPSFGGLNPEPIDVNLSELMKQVGQGDWDIGLATDGDADRIGAVDADGLFVNSHQIFALLLQHYIEDKGLTGTIIKSISTTQMINRLCESYDLKLIETPIGFKHICKKLVETDALMGGEESGGISFQPHVHERDGVLNGLMLLEMMAMRGKSLRQLLDDLYAKIGPHFFTRYDAHLTQEQIEGFKQDFKGDGVKEVAGQSVVATDFRDGFKYFLKDGSWLLLRASGTEPLVRIYAEASEADAVDRVIAAGKDFVLR